MLIICRNCIAYEITISPRYPLMGCMCLLQKPVFMVAECTELDGSQSGIRAVAFSQIHQWPRHCRLDGMPMSPIRVSIPEIGLNPPLKAPFTLIHFSMLLLLLTTRLSKWQIVQPVEWRSKMPTSRGAFNSKYVEKSAKIAVLDSIWGRFKVRRVARFNLYI